MDTTYLKIHCCGCGGEVTAKLVTGKDVYPHRKDLATLPFWMCEGCSNYVGCHYKTKERLKPLGNIPTKELRIARQHIHKILDNVWQTGKTSRSGVYKTLSAELGYEYHTAKLTCVEEARTVFRLIKSLWYG